MSQVFQDFNPSYLLNDQLIVESIINEVIRVDYESDAVAYLSDIQMQIDPHNFVPCDPSGKFSDDCVVLFDDGSYSLFDIQPDEGMMMIVDEEENMKGTQQFFDVYLTRVEIGKFQPGGDYLFYRMQIVIDRSRALPILLTRWGRIGEEGAFQKTPFSTVKEAVAEFKKIFE